MAEYPAARKEFFHKSLDAKFLHCGNGGRFFSGNGELSASLFTKQLKASQMAILLGITGREGIAADGQESGLIYCYSGGSEARIIQVLIDFLEQLQLLTRQ